MAVNEQWVCEQLQCQEEDVVRCEKAMLVGHRFKISDLQDSLKRFSSLQFLDLSRNHLSSLDGLHTLKLLHTLNLYYNQITDPTEVACATSLALTLRG